jgi:hypothetical protein
MRTVAVVLSVCLGVGALAGAAFAAQRTVVVEHFTTSSS